MLSLGAFLLAVEIKDWAELLHAVAWPFVALVAVFRFHSVIESLLERLIAAEGLGVKVTLAKLNKETPKAEIEAKRVRLKEPKAPKPGE